MLECRGHAQYLVLVPRCWGCSKCSKISTAGQLNTSWVLTMNTADKATCSCRPTCHVCTVCNWLALFKIQLERPIVTWKSDDSNSRYFHVHPQELATLLAMSVSRLRPLRTRCNALHIGHLILSVYMYSNLQTKLFCTASFILSIMIWFVSPRNSFAWLQALNRWIHTTKHDKSCHTPFWDLLTVDWPVVYGGRL